MHEIEKLRVGKSMNLDRERELSQISEAAQRILRSDRRCVPVERIRYKTVEKRTNEKILFSPLERVEYLSGGDQTEGSCASLMLAYLGQKLGYEVRDFRGGNSQKFFANGNLLEEIFSLPKDSHVMKSDAEGDQLENTMKLLEREMEAGKEYGFVSGSHAAIIGKLETGRMYYAEMQNRGSQQNGVRVLNMDTLKNRFHCTEKSPPSILAPLDSFEKDEQAQKDLRVILGFLNTDELDQDKGINGYAK